MPSLSESQQDEMARRSARLVGRRGFYPPDDETASTSSTGSNGQISYRESPVRVFKRKTGSRKAGGPSRTSIVTNQSQSPNVDEPYKGESFTARGSPSFRTLSATASTFTTTTPIELPGSSSGYSSSEEGISTSHHTHTSSSGSSQPPAAAGFGLRDVLNSPVRAFAMLYFWLGTAWYSLTSTMSLLDVSLLSRCSAGMRKAILLLLFLLLLLFGVWFLFPYRPAPPLKHQTQTPVQSKSVPASTALDPRLSELKETFFARLQEHESKWMEARSREMEEVLRDIMLLKEDGERHKVQYEDLKIRVRNVDSEHRSLIKQEISEVQTQMAGLKSDISKLHSASEHLTQRMDVQDSRNTKLKAELSDWLLQQISGSFRSEGDAVMRPDLQVALEKLEKKILDRMGQERNMEKKDAWRSVGETLTQEGVGSITIKDVELIVHRALSLYRADGIAMADYALESSGASVINTRCSETYHTKTACVSLFGFPLWYPSESPRTVIQPELYPGKCWPFRGSEGFLVIGLSHQVQITHISMEHLPRVLSPTGNINSAPKDFSVYGLLNESDTEGKLLGTFTYDQDEEPIQTFKLPGSPADVYQLVELRILSNWGHPEYTCLYRFRVHGIPQGI